MSKEETKFIAPEITCGGCAAAITKAVSKIDGVENVTVDVATKKVSVTHDDKVSRETIDEAMDIAGFSTKDE